MEAGSRPDAEMPLYDYACECGHKMEIFHPIRNCSDVYCCPRCSERMQRQLSAPRVLGDYAGYSCPITGDWIEGKKAHRENLAKHGCRVLESGEREAMFQRKRQMDAKLEETVVETAILDLQTMPDQKFEVLAGELVRGGDVDLVRKTQEG